MNRSLLSALCLLLVPLAPLAPAFAADAYVPLATNLPLGAATYRTILIATNTGGSPAGFTLAFLASGTDGSAPQPASYTLPPGVTLRLYNAVPAGARGMWELAGAPEIVVSARIEALAEGGAVLASSQVPVIAADEVFRPGQQAQVQGLEQTANGAGSDLGIVNLGTSAAHCSVDGFRADGRRIGGTVSLTLPPRSNNDFRGALSTLGQTSIKDARLTVSCDQTFSPWALVFRAGGPETVVLGPGAALDRDLTPAPPPADGSVLFTLPGQFADGAHSTSFDLPLRDGVPYGQAHVEFDVYLDHWQRAFPGNPMFHNVASFRRSADKRPDRLLYWGLIFKGTDEHRTILDMGVPPGGREGTTIKSGSGPWKERVTYHLVFDYDAAAGTVNFQAFQGGTRVQQLSGALNNTDISNQPGKSVRVDFSSEGIGDGAYFPTLGWKYSNLTVKLTPRR
jgi:hypothetical protein